MRMTTPAFIISPKRTTCRMGPRKRWPEAYGRGCKLYGVFSTGAQMQKAAAALEAALDRRGLVRDGDNLRLALHSGERHRPERPAGAAAFTAFHCSFSVASSPLPPDIPSFSLSNGLCGESAGGMAPAAGQAERLQRPPVFRRTRPARKEHPHPGRRRHGENPYHDFPGGLYLLFPEGSPPARWPGALS